MRCLSSLAVAMITAQSVMAEPEPYNSTDGKCRALAMSGGSNYGAWEVGVLWGLLNYGDPADYAWDVITGVSAGAINTGATAVFATGDELNMVDFLSETW